jgi:hypothetical protein
VLPSSVNDEPELKTYLAVNALSSPHRRRHLLDEVVGWTEVMCGIAGSSHVQSLMGTLD